MDIKAISTIVEDLKEVATTISTVDRTELKKMKADLDKYVGDITSRLPEQSKEIALREFEKCRTYAHDWMNVYSDSAFHAGTKTDILQEEAMEFFFTMDEKIVSIQKNFFVLGMIDEVLTPGEPFSEQKRATKIAKSKIRILAREQGLTASCKTRPDPLTGIVSEDCFWYFGDDRNFLQSDEAGLTDDEAIDYLLR